MARARGARGARTAPRVEHWFALVGETALMQALLDERERSQLLFDLAVRAGEDVELVAWLVQATFDPKDLVRRLTARDRHGEPAAFITALPDRD